MFVSNLHQLGICRVKIQDPASLEKIQKLSKILPGPCQIPANVVVVSIFCLKVSASKNNFFYGSIKKNFGHKRREREREKTGNDTLKPTQGLGHTCVIFGESKILRGL